ncbi:hypothetical protein HZH66_012163 [Vespula vulgaris]|uniref:Uncharacterized protein n=2 Tax=Vespula TaxID=7451 RepID=A0A834JDC7_VESVU|nr:hypothetical protein HZH66_012163 [Vespula vulgaris]
MSFSVNLIEIIEENDHKRVVIRALRKGFLDYPPSSTSTDDSKSQQRTASALYGSRYPYKARLKKERRARKRLQEQLDLEIKRRTQLEEALKATGASSEQVRAITENVTTEARTSTEPPEASPVHSQSQQQPSQQQSQQQPLQQQQTAAQQYREAQVPRPSQQPSTPEKPAWGYGLDLIGSQASAFWQNYQESLVQELELERKSRQHQVAERDQVKSPLQGAIADRLLQKLSTVYECDLEDAGRNWTRRRAYQSKRLRSGRGRR